MAAYAALLSLNHILNRVQNPHPSHVFLEKLQTNTLSDQVSFLIDFLEGYSQKKSEKIKIIDREIVDVAYATEDIIESYIVDQILAKPASDKDRKYATFRKDRRLNFTKILAKPGGDKDRRYAAFHKNLKKVVKKLNLIEKKVMKIKLADDDKKHFNDKNPHSRIEAAAGAAGTSSSNINAKETPPAAGGNKNDSTMVGFDEDLEKLMELLSIDRSDRLIIPIVGMGGIGKTTLSRNAYDNPFIVEHFVIRAWVTISLEYSVREIILGLLYDTRVINQNLGGQNKSTDNLASFTDRMSKKSDEQLGETLHKCLFGRKYLIMLDDIWNSSAWDEIKRFLPDNNKGSRIMMTTRLSDLALSLGSLSPHEMKFLDVDKSWDLLSVKVFGQQHVCPQELEKFGRIIAKKCRGLPLAIVVIGGLLRVSNKTHEYWENVAENVNSIVNAENDENCLKLLSLSYNQLPVHLKPLFLYMATFPEDSVIEVSRLTKLWVSEGFLKPTINKTPEEVAVEYLKDLIDRNLIMVQKRSRTGNIKTCNIHDLLRDVCLREAQNERFLCVTKVCKLDSIPQRKKVERRLCVLRSTREKKHRCRVTFPLQSMSLARSLVCNFEWISPCVFSYRLLRVLDVVDTYSFDDIKQLVNSRYLAFSVNWSLNPTRLYSSISRLWNLETLIVGEIEDEEIIMPSKIWQMPYLRHLEFCGGVYLPDPPPVDDGDQNYSRVRLNNLQTLLVIKDFLCTDEVLCRIPNLKKLKIVYKYAEGEEVTYCLHNLVHFHKLETLDCFFSYPLHEIKTLSKFPPHLKKLVLGGSKFPWEKMRIIGSLPNLQVLEILFDAFCGREWNLNEGEFQCLRFLSIKVSDLEIWRAESSNIFPALEHLVLNAPYLEEIPWGIGEIISLQSIDLWNCKSCVVAQAKEMLEEQEMQGNYDLQIHVHIWKHDPELQSLASENFHIADHTWKHKCLFTPLPIRA